MCIRSRVCENIQSPGGFSNNMYGNIIHRSTISHCSNNKLQNNENRYLIVDGSIAELPLLQSSFWQVAEFYQTFALQ